MMQRNEYRVVHMTERHVAAAAQLERECFSDPWSESMIREELENGLGVFVAAEQDDVLLGYAGMQAILDEGYIANVAVTGSARRRGIGTALLQELIRAARGRKLSFLTLEVRESNVPAIHLYQSFGFRPVGVRKGYYKNPTEDALLLTLQLTE